MEVARLELSTQQGQPLDKGFPGAETLESSAIGMSQEEPWGQIRGSLSPTMSAVEKEALQRLASHKVPVQSEHLNTWASASQQESVEFGISQKNRGKHVHLHGEWRQKIVILPFCFLGGEEMAKNQDLPSPSTSSN